MNIVQRKRASKKQVIRIHMVQLKQTSQAPVLIWLLFCCAMVFCMIVIGAITRLTESGLSMVEWRPLIGTLPPLSQEEWERVFAIYQQTPEYQQKNFWMGLSDFKTIFFWEWFHRLWGRLIGVAFAVPLIFFAIWRMIPKGQAWKYIAMLFLGGAQGVMGWYMVESGLVDIPAVSHYRLAAHLSLAFLILCLLFWLALDLIKLKDHSHHKGLFAHAIIALISLCATIFWGAYVAGLDAGLIYNEYPLMGGSFFPAREMILEPYWINFLETHAGVQFTHRWLAAFSLVIILGFSVHAALRGVNCNGFHALGFMVIVQFGLGIATLLSAVWLPLGVLHQAGAAILLLLMTYTLKVTWPR